MNSTVKVRIGLVAALLGVVGVMGCAASGSSARARVVGPATPQAQAMFDQIKGLAGTWEMTDENGQRITGAIYRVVSAGSAVCERMFPGSDHEMINMYHLDGDRVLVTHYCAQGNQPRMAARSRASANLIAFEPESVTNLVASDIEYMARFELDMTDADHITQRWQSMTRGEPTSHAEFRLTRLGS